MRIEIQSYEKDILLLLVKGEREIETGEGYDLDSVLSEADVVLTNDPS